MHTYVISCKYIYLGKITKLFIKHLHYIKLFSLTLKPFTFKIQFSKHHFYTHRSPLNHADFPSNSRFPSDNPFHIFQEKQRLNINHNFNFNPQYTFIFTQPHHIHFNPIERHLKYTTKEMTKIPFTLQNDLNTLNSNPFLC